MQLHTFKARSLSEALRLIRRELGPDASVLHTRELGTVLSRWLGGHMIEVTASAELMAPSRLPTGDGAHSDSETGVPRAELQDFRRKMREHLLAADDEPSLVEQLAAQPTKQAGSHSGISGERIDGWFQRLEAELVCDPDCHVDRAFERLRRIISSDMEATQFWPLTIDK